MPRPKKAKYLKQVYIGSVDGRRKYKKVTANTKKELEVKADKVRAKYKREKGAYRPTDPFKVFAESYLDTHDTGNDTSYEIGVRGRVNYWIEQVGDYPVTDIVCSMLQEPLNKLARENPKTKRPTSRKTIRDYIGNAIQIFDIAVKDRVIDYNPARDLEVPKVARKKEKRRALTDEEQQWVLDTPHRAQLVAMIMMYGGPRRGEVVPLRAMDIDLEGNAIHISRSVQFIKNEPVIKPSNDPTKTDSGVRVAGIPDILVEYLRPILANKFPLDLVVPGEDGKMMTESAWRAMWDSYLAELNFKYGSNIDLRGNIAKSKFNPNGLEFTIPHFTSHWLRHTYATILYHSDVGLLEAAEMMGHSDTKMITEVYTHLDKESKKRSMKKVNDYLGNKKICIPHAC